LSRRLFALDQNFPQPIVDLLVEYQEEADLVPIRDIDARLATLDDWEVLLALHLHDQEWDGLITTDSSMLNLPRELAVLLQTKLTLVVPMAAGHDPVKATGLLFAYLPAICARTTPNEAQIWTLRAAQPPGLEAWGHLERLADRRSQSAEALYQAARLSKAELATNPLD
jgi:hypothetical protein